MWLFGKKAITSEEMIRSLDSYKKEFEDKISSLDDEDKKEEYVNTIC